MKRSGIMAVAIIVVAWIALGEWQRREYVHQRALIRHALAGQADSIVTALVSGVRSHRWIGPFFQDQLPGTLDELAKSDSVLAVAIVPIEDGDSSGAEESSKSGDGRDSSLSSRVYLAGDGRLLDFSDSAGVRWQDGGYYVIRPFELNAGSEGSGPRRRGGGGFGRGGRPPWLNEGDELPTRFKAMLVLDRKGSDEQIEREARIRGMLFLSGGLLILFIGFSWRATVRLAAARGQASLLRAESRHLTELGQAGAGLAHETRNPLGLIRGWTQRLADIGLPTPEQQQQANAIVEECDRVTSRINEFLTFARPVRPQLAPVQIRRLIEQLRILLETDIEQRSLSVDLDGVPADLVIQADAEQLRQAVFNLVQNAITFAKDGGCVTIRMVAGQGRMWRLEVTDDGPGPAPDIVGSLFEPYFTTRPSGTGLGLAIVQNIAVAHGWSVGYSPGRNDGGVFWIDQIRKVRPR